MAERQRHLPRLAKSHLHEKRLELGGLVVLAVVLQVAAGVGMAYVAGFRVMDHVLAGVRWPWVGGVAGGLLLASVGSYYATSGIYQVGDGPRLRRRQLRSVVIAGFSGFLARGGSGLDKYAIEAAGRDEREARVRIEAFGGLEHGVLSLFGTAAGITLLVMALSVPPLDFSVPWAVIPVPGFLLAFWLAGRYAPRLREAGGWRGGAGVFLDAILLIRRLFTRDLLRHPAVFGMLLFWAAEMFSIWSGLAAFGFHMNAAQLVIGAGTGMLFTRRTGPLAGAGILVVTPSASIWYSGAPLAVAVAGVFAYRAFALWLPMSFGLAQIPTLRAMGERAEPGAGGTAAAEGEPALPDRKAS